VDKKVVAIVEERAGGYCEVCGLPAQPSMALHHRKLRSRGGKDTASNLIRVHHGCHNLKTSSIRYDENLPLKEDYDISLEHIRTYGGCLRINYAHYEVKQAEQAGGCATYRNLKREKEQFFLLQKKWGKDIITRDKASKRSFDFNPIIKVPIKEVTHHRCSQ